MDVALWNCDGGGNMKLTNMLIWRIFSITYWISTFYLFGEGLNDEIDLSLVSWLVDFCEGFLVTDLSLKSEKSVSDPVMSNSV